MKISVGVNMGLRFMSRMVMIMSPMVPGVVMVVRMGGPTVRVLVEMFVRVLVAMRMAVFMAVGLALVGMLVVVSSSKAFQRGQGLFHLFVLSGGLLRH
jgi:hypothetical protein